MLLSERSQSKKASLYDSSYMTFWKRQNYADGKEKRNQCQGLQWRDGRINISP